MNNREFKKIESCMEIKMINRELILHGKISMQKWVEFRNLLFQGISKSKYTPSDTLDAI